MSTIISSLSTTTTTFNNIALNFNCKKDDIKIDFDITASYSDDDDVWCTDDFEIPTFTIVHDNSKDIPLKIELIPSKDVDIIDEPKVVVDSDLRTATTTATVTTATTAAIASNNAINESTAFTILGFPFQNSITEKPLFSNAMSYMSAKGIERLSNLQQDMLASLLNKESFQVTSHCGSGKTSLLLFAYVACLCDDSTLIFVYDHGERHKSLRTQVISTIDELSGSALKVLDLGEGDARKLTHGSNPLSLREYIQSNGIRVILTPCSQIANVVDSVDGNLLLTFDECQSIFSPSEAGTRHLNILREHVAGSLSKCRERAQVICMSAVGDMTESSAVVSDFMKLHFGQDLPIINAQQLSEGQGEGDQCSTRARSRQECDSVSNSMHETYIVHLSDHEAIWEQTIGIALTFLMDGRNLIVCKPQQVETFLKCITSEYPAVTVTSNRQYWEDPRYKVIIVREDELVELEGLNIDGLSCVFLTTIAKERAIHRSFQAIGRVGRLGQTATRAFVFMDKSNSKNSERESGGQRILQENLMLVSQAKEVHVTSKTPLSAFNCRPFDHSISGLSETDKQALISKAQALNAIANKICVCPLTISVGPNSSYCSFKYCKYVHPSDVFQFEDRWYVDGSKYTSISSNKNALQIAICKCAIDANGDLKYSKRCPNHYKEALRCRIANIPAPGANLNNRSNRSSSQIGLSNLKSIGLAANVRGIASQPQEQSQLINVVATAVPAKHITEASIASLPESLNNNDKANRSLAASHCSVSRVTSAAWTRPVLDSSHPLHTKSAAISSQTHTTEFPEQVINRSDTNRESIGVDADADKETAVGWSVVKSSKSNRKPTTATDRALKPAATINNIISSLDDFPMLSATTSKTPQRPIIVVPPSTNNSSEVEIISRSCVETSLEAATAASYCTPVTRPGETDSRICKSCCFRLACHGKSSRFIHRGDSRFTNDEVLQYMKSFGERNVCRMAFFDVSRCAKGEACPYAHPNSPFMTDEVTESFRASYIIANTNENRLIPKCGLRKDHNHRYCRFVHLSDKRLLSR